MSIRKIVKIDDEKCDGCGLCIPDCKEGALEIIDGKARLVSDSYCDGLGACLGSCPNDAITIIERDAEEFDEVAVEAKINKTKDNKLHSHKAMNHECGCPSSAPRTIKANSSPRPIAQNVQSALTNWPIQLKLAPVSAPYFENADLLICADCVPFTYPDFHTLLEGKTLLIGCPKLDEADFYAEKIADIIRQNNLNSITVAYMEVPCCYGLLVLTKEAINKSGKDISLAEEKYSIQGGKIDL